MSEFLKSPPEVIQQVALFAVCHSPLGPPSVLRALLLTCRTFHRALSSSALYADIFSYLFDSAAPTHRLGKDWLSAENINLELRQRFLALRCFQQRRLDDAYLPQSLLVAYLMVLENDGRNVAQLRWAGLPSLLQAFIRNGALDGDDHGWPMENETNSLVVSLAWFLSPVWPERDGAIIRSLGAYTFAAFRYPCSNVAERNFHGSRLDRGKFVAKSVHGPYPPSRVEPRDVVHYGRTIRVQTPPISVPALLSYFSAITSLPMAAVSTETNMFDTRAEADAVGSHGPTREDISLVNSGNRTRNANPSQHGSSSRAHDPDWARAVQYLDPSSGLSLLIAAHKPGGLTGSWKGTSITPGFHQYTDWLSNITTPASFDECCSRRPMYFTLQEYFCHVPAAPVPPDDDENGIINAWLPPSCQLSECEGGIEISDRRGTFKAFYETVLPESDLDGGRCVLDIIVMGKTNDPHEAAWGGYRFVGRIRLSDGLIILLSEPTHPEITGADKVLFRGYITSSHFAGRWRSVSNYDPAPLETAFSFCRDQ